MDELVLMKMNLNVFGSNFAIYPSPPLSPLSFQSHEGSYFPDAKYFSICIFANDRERDSRVVDRQHDALKLLMNGNHVRRIRNPRSILDLGSGKGAWTMDIANEFMTADEVVGVDIERNAPIYSPPNCRFEVSWNLHMCLFT
jgi:hypothetical protein